MNKKSLKKYKKIYNKLNHVFKIFFNNVNNVQTCLSF